MQLKSIIRKIAAENHVSAQLIMQNYMMERLLERISLSNYSHNFILKGGFLIASMVGLNNRATMDIDTTINGINLTHDSIRSIFDELCNTNIDDQISFSVLKLTDIRNTDDYPGIRISLEALYLSLRVPLSVDLTTGDIITPKEIEYSYKLIIDDRKINIRAYNLETILAEKIETILSRNIANTRIRDFYDVYILSLLKLNECRIDVLRVALKETSIKRGSENTLSNYVEIINHIRSSERMNHLWTNYQHDFDYAKNIVFDEICFVLLNLMNQIMNK